MNHYQKEMLIQISDTTIDRYLIIIIFTDKIIIASKCITRYSSFPGWPPPPDATHGEVATQWHRQWLRERISPAFLSLFLQELRVASCFMVYSCKFYKMFPGAQLLCSLSERTGWLRSTFVACCSLLAIVPHANRANLCRRLRISCWIECSLPGSKSAITELQFSSTIALLASFRYILGMEKQKKKRKKCLNC